MAILAATPGWSYPTGIATIGTPSAKASGVVFSPAGVMQSAARFSSSICGAMGTTIVFDGIDLRSPGLTFLPTERITSRKLANRFENGAVQVIEAVDQCSHKSIDHGLTG